MSKIYRINKNEIENLPILAEGYKIFNEDWICINYCYADETGTAVGTVHKIEGELAMCDNGFHFCKKLENCFKHYEPIQSNKIAKVRAYGKIIGNDEKNCCSIIEIVEELHWDNIRIKMTGEGINNVYTSAYVHGSKKVVYSNNISGSIGINNSNDVAGGYDINNSQYIHGSTVISYSNSVHGSYNISKSLGIYGSINVKNSSCINGCNDVQDSHRIYGGNDIYYSQNICGGFCIYFSVNLKGAYNCIFCIDLDGTQCRIFNKKVTEEYFNKVCRDIFEIIYYTRYHMIATNYEELHKKYGNIIPINQLQPKHLDYSEMPQELLNYIKNLPEYDEKIFNEIINYNSINIKH